MKARFHIFIAVKTFKRMNGHVPFILFIFEMYWSLLAFPICSQCLIVKIEGETVRNQIADGRVITRAWRKLSTFKNLRSVTYAGGIREYFLL
jgi:hypothetical protein